MTTHSTYTSRDHSAVLALLREGFAVALLLAGVVGLVVAGFLIGFPQGLAGLSLVLVCSGIALGYERDSSTTRR